MKEDYSEEIEEKKICNFCIPPIVIGIGGKKKNEYNKIIKKEQDGKMKEK